MAWGRSLIRSLQVEGIGDEGNETDIVECRNRHLVMDPPLARHGAARHPAGTCRRCRSCQARSPHQECLQHAIQIRFISNEIHTNDQMDDQMSCSELPQCCLA